MTPQEIDKLEPGRELDALVAEKVMGWLWCIQACGDISRPGQYEWSRFLAPPANAAAWRDIWNGKTEAIIEERPRFAMGFSTDIAAAWLVVEKMRQTKRFCCLKLHSDFDFVYSFSLTLYTQRYQDCGRHEPDFIAQAQTAPLAVCRAALKAVKL
jgi:ABA sandwich protein